jgi:hypothetical protein
MIVKTVKRGYNLRYMPEEFWDETLYLIPKGAELFDPDCTPYYIDVGDGTPLVETYTRYASYEFDTYQAHEPYEDTVAYLEEGMREQKKRMLERQAQEDRQKTKESMLRKIQEGMNKKQKR